MKLNKPVITTLLIIILVFDLIFFSFSLVCKKLTNTKNITSIVMNFDLKKNIIENEMIEKNISNYKYPKEIFNNLDKKEIRKEQNKIINALITNESEIINEKSIEKIIINSVNIYDKKNKTDSYNYSKDDIKQYSNKLSYLINNEYKSLYNILKRVGQNQLLILYMIIFIIISIIIYKFENNTMIFIDSISLILYSFFIYYINNNFYKIFDLQEYSKYIKLHSLDLDFTYIICFILGVVLLLMYIVKIIHKTIKMNKIGWR